MPQLLLGPILRYADAESASLWVETDAPCEVERVDTVSCEIKFAEQQWAVTPGQSVVVYESKVCLGGGIIKSAVPAQR